jgi:hypothetical protein
LVTLGGQSTFTNAVGAFSFSNVSSGSWPLTPQLAGCIFVPTPPVTVTVSNANVTGQNFVATCGVPLPPAGWIGGHWGPPGPAPAHAPVRHQPVPKPKQ